MSADSRRMDRIRGYRDAGITVGQHDVDWLIAEVERLTVELRASETESLKHALAVGQACIELSEEKREVKRLTAERDRYKAWHDGVVAMRTQGYVHADELSPFDERELFLELNAPCDSCCELIVRPQPLKENE